MTTPTTPRRGPISSASSVPAANAMPKRRVLRETSTLFGSSNNFVLHNDPSVTAVYPKFNEGSLVFRAFPNLDFEAYARGERKLAGYRLSQDPNQFDSDWLRKYPCASFVGIGDDAVTFILYDEDWGESYDRTQNPYLVFYNNVRKAVKRDRLHPEWAFLIEGSKGKGASIPAATDMFLCQGAIYKNGKERFMSPKDPPRGLMPNDQIHVVMFKGSDKECTGGYRLMHLANMVNPEWKGDPTDYENSMLYGDLLSPEHGRFITIYNPALETPGEVDDEDVIGEDVDIDEIRRAGGTDRKTDNKPRGYMVRIDEHVIVGNHVYEKTTPKFGQKTVQGIVDRVKLWDPLTRIESNEVQALWVCKAFRQARSLVEFAYQEHPEWITQEAKRILANSKQISMTGTQPDDVAPEAGERRRSVTADDDEAEAEGLYEDDDAGVDEQPGDETYSQDAEESADISEQEAGEYEEEEYEEAGEAEGSAEDEIEYEEEVEVEVDAEVEADGEVDQSEYEEGGEVEEEADGEGEEEAQADADPEYEDGTEEQAEEESAPEPAPAPAPDVAAIANRAKANATKQAAARKAQTVAAPPVKETAIRKPVGAKPAGTKPATPVKAGTKPPVGTKPAGTKPAGTKPVAGTRPAGTKPVVKPGTKRPVKK
jgi:hypothetical protein